jgi:hypothetical protein
VKKASVTAGKVLNLVEEAELSEPEEALSTVIEEISDEPVEDQVETSDEPVEHQIEVSDESKEESEEVASKDSTELEDAAEDSKEEK